MRSRGRSAGLFAIALAGCGATAPAPAPSCAVEDAPDGTRVLVCTDGTRIPVADDVSCTVAPAPAGGALISCSDGSSTTLAPAPGASCTAAAAPDGGAIVRCSDGTEARIPPGPDGASCTIVPGEAGASVLRCADGTEVELAGGADGASCTARDNGDGSYTLTCGDGTEVTFHDGEPGAPCTVRDHGDGTKTIARADGTEVTVSDGAPGGPCTARDNRDGTITIACPDGTEVTVSDGADGTSCSVTGNADGTYTVSCTDGTSVRVWPGEGTGTIEGRAYLVGADDHGGITVRVEDVDASATTDATGAYRLEGVTAGMHVLLFEHEGHRSERLDGVPVLPGTYHPRDVTLRVGERLATGDTLPLALSAAGDEALFLRDPVGSQPPVGELVHLDLASGAETSVALGVDRAEFGAAPGQIVFRTDGGALWLAQLPARTFTHLADEVWPEWLRGPAPDALYAFAAVAAPAGSTARRGTLLHVDLAVGTSTPVATDVRLGSVWPLASGVLYIRRDGPYQVLERWDVSAESAPGQAWEGRRRCRPKPFGGTHAAGTLSPGVLPGRGWHPAGTECCVRSG